MTKPIRRADVAEALRATGGIYTAAAAYIARKHNRTCDHRTISNHIAKSYELQQIERDVRESTLDVAEAQLLAAVQKGQPWAIKLILKTKGKDRGYSERVETTGAGGGPVQVIIAGKDADL